MRGRKEESKGGKERGERKDIVFSKGSFCEIDWLRSLCINIILASKINYHIGRYPVRWTHLT